MRVLPSGTVTLFFSDIEGSTRLLHELGERYADVLAEHRRLLRGAFSRHGGVEVDTQGDAFFVAFARASDAVTAAREAQETLADGPVRVRMGIHTGEPLVTQEGYVGVDVHRAARIMGAGHGGQVLLSETTRQLLDSPVETADLGEHRLKDLTAPQRLYQLGGAEFPPLRTLHQTNLPIQSTALVGRRRELEEAGALLRSHRLLTLTGPAGSGKTRLALQLAAEAWSPSPTGSFGFLSRRSAIQASWSVRSGRRSAQVMDWSSTLRASGCSFCWTTSSKWSRPRPPSPRFSPRHRTRRCSSPAASRCGSRPSSGTRSRRSLTMTPQSCSSSELAQLRPSFSRRLR